MKKRFLALRKHLPATVIVAVFGLLGAVGLHQLKAATSITTIESETGTVTAPADVINDSSASLGKSIRFGEPTVTCPNANNTPGGSNGQGDCFPYAGNTGVKSGTTLTNYTGSMTISTAGTVIENKIINGGLTITANNVIIRNSRMNISSYYGLLINGQNTTIEDTTIIGGLTAGIAANGGSFTATRVNIYGGEDGVRLGNNSKLIDSYVHDLVGTADSHFDTVTADGFRGWEVRGNTILNSYTQTAAIWVGDPRFDPSEGLVTGNLMGGGGYCMYAGSGIGAGIRITNNVFSKTYFSRCGYYGLVANWQSAGNTWSGNTYSDGTVASP